jgi:hypothetical protein
VEVRHQLLADQLEVALQHQPEHLAGGVALPEELENPIAQHVALALFVAFVLRLVCHVVSPSAPRFVRGGEKDDYSNVL